MKDIPRPFQVYILIDDRILEVVQVEVGLTRRQSLFSAETLGRADVDVDLDLQSRRVYLEYLAISFIPRLGLTLGVLLWSAEWYSQCKDCIISYLLVTLDLNYYATRNILLLVFVKPKIRELVRPPAQSFDLFFELGQLIDCIRVCFSILVSLADGVGFDLESDDLDFILLLELVIEPRLYLDQVRDTIANFVARRDVVA